MNAQVIVYPTDQDLAVATGARLLLAISDVLAVKEVAHIGLTGGTIGIELLAQAARNPLKTAVDWSGVHIWWGDERFVAPDSDDRNAVGAREALLASLDIPEDHIHEIPGTDRASSVAAAAEQYAAALAAYGHSAHLPFPALDVTLLGMGPDGHIASLFPTRTELLVDGAATVAVTDSPKPPPERVSLTRHVLNTSAQVWFVVSGAEKAPALKRALEQAGTEPTAELIGDGLLPAATISGTERTLWLVDATAAT